MIFDQTYKDKSKHIFPLLSTHMALCWMSFNVVKAGICGQNFVAEQIITLGFSFNFFFILTLY